jgi:cytochrome c-type biogenesis protein CcmH
MSWILVALLALVAFVVAAFVLKAPRRGWEAIASALVLGVAGYALQAHPGLAGAPKAPSEDPANEKAAMVEVRQQLGKEQGLPADNWLVVGDALARHGQFADAAGIYSGVVAKSPKNVDGWLALANALVAHADNTLTPAAILAFRRAGEANPQHPGPPFFYGLALAQSGRLEEARATWADLLRASPPDAPWRAELEQRLASLDAFIRDRQARVGRR